MKIQIRSFLPAVLALIVATVLFCLPGDKFPDGELFDILEFDKIIHVGLFTVLVIFWSLPLMHRIKNIGRLHNIFVGIALVFILYGIMIEFVQGHFIPNRTMGIDDMVADALGCAVGYIVIKKVMKANQASL